MRQAVRRSPIATCVSCVLYWTGLLVVYPALTPPKKNADAMQNATTVPMAQNVDAALLGVFIGETSVVAASRTIDEVGRPKFLGSVVLNASLAK